MLVRHEILRHVGWAVFALAACGGEVSMAPLSAGVPASPANPLGADSTVREPDIGTPPELREPLDFNATMTGREEVPAIYATAATGTGTFSLDAARTTLRYTVTHTLAGPTAAHLHLGIAGESGAVLLPLAVAPGAFSGAVPVTPEQARSIEQGRAYVDIHSAEHPDGELRGQLVLPGEIVYVARLTPDQETSPTETTGAGLGAFLVDGTTRRMRYVVEVHGLSGELTKAVIGMGSAGLDGVTVVDLADPKTLPSAAFAGVRSIASSQDLDLGRWYVNVHSRRFPWGEARGQILRPGQELYVGRMTGAETVPPVQTTARFPEGEIRGQMRRVGLSR